MNILKLSPVAIFFSLLLCFCSSRTSNKSTLVSMKTTFGDIKIRLYNETPLHRDNFIKLVNSGYYDGISFHRIINDFMIQAGDYSTRKPALQPPADTISDSTLPPEFVPGLIHKRGALAAARMDNSINPEMRSSATQFYIVQGCKMTESEFLVQQQERDNNIRQGEFIRLFMHMSDSCSKSGSGLTPGEIQEKALLKLYELPDKGDLFKTTEDQKKEYMLSGGVPRLDGTYTVFGEVIEGIEIVDRIATANTNPDDKPVENISIIKMKIIKK